VPLEFFIDRSLGRHAVPTALRTAGAIVQTMAGIYGEQVGQGLADEDWLSDVGERGWVVLLKDAKIRYRPAELGAIITHGIRAFCLANANLRPADQAERLVANLPQITRLAEEVGPYIYRRVRGRGTSTMAQEVIAACNWTGLSAAIGSAASDWGPHCHVRA
jgi:hypothetical protein